MAGFVTSRLAIPTFGGSARRAAADFDTTAPHGVAPMQFKRTSTPDPDAATPAPQRVPHRPKVEYYDVSDFTKTDARGFVRSVDSYHTEPWGLYLVRAADEPPNRYTETWLLPELSIRITMHHVNAAHDRNPLYHIYLGDYARIEPKRWRAIYHYVNIETRNGHACELHGVDDLFAANAAGHIDTATTHRVLESATSVVDGIASHDHNVEHWLADRDIRLTWL